MTALASYFPIAYFYDAAESAPSVPTLTVTDNGNGSGATATIAGSTPGTTNTVYTQSLETVWQPPIWQTSGSRTGNGTVSLALPPGHYLAYVISAGSGSACSSTIYFVTTAGATSIKSQILAAVAVRIQSLNLANIATASIVVKKLPISRYLESASPNPIALPAVIVADVAPENMPPRGTCQLDDVDYPIQVSLIEVDNQESTVQANHDQHLLWRETIEQAFRFQRLPGVTTVINCTVEPSAPIDQGAWMKNYYASALTLRFTSREPRT